MNEETCRPEDHIYDNGNAGRTPECVFCQSPNYPLAVGPVTEWVAAMMADMEREQHERDSK